MALQLRIGDPIRNHGCAAHIRRIHPNSDFTRQPFEAGYDLEMDGEVVRQVDYHELQRFGRLQAA